MSKFSKFTKAGIALALVILTLLSTFTVALAALLPEGADSGNEMNKSKLLQFYYPSDLDARRWESYRYSSSRYRMDKDNNSGGNVASDVHYATSPLYSPTNKSSRTYVHQYTNYDFTMDIETSDYHAGWKYSEGDNALSKVYYAQTTDDNDVNYLKNNETVVPGWRSGGASSIFGTAFGDKEFTNVAQCMIQPSANDFVRTGTDNTTDNDYKFTIADKLLYGIDNDNARSKMFYYFTPRMTVTKSGNTRFAVQTMKEADSITGETVSTIGSGLKLTDRQLTEYKTILIEKLTHLYGAEENWPGRAKHVMNELKNGHTSIKVNGEDFQFHILGHYDENGNYVVTYEDLFHFISFAFMLTNDICDDRQEVRSAFANIGTSWGFVHDTTPCDNISIVTSQKNNVRTTKLAGHTDPDKGLGLSHERFNQSTIFQLEHAFMSWLSIGDKSGFDGHAVSNWSYKNPQYIDKGRDIDAWGGGFLLDMDVVQTVYDPRNNKNVDNDSTYAKEQAREREIMKDVLVTMFYTRQDLMPPVPPEVVVFYYYPSNPDKSGGRYPTVDTRTGKAFAHEGNSNGGNKSYTQVYVSSAIMRTPVLITKKAEVDEASGLDHIKYYSDYTGIELKLYETYNKSSSTVENEVALGNYSGKGSSNYGNIWDTMVPDKWLDKSNNSLKFSEETLPDGTKCWMTGLYLLRWGGYKNDHAPSGKTYDRSYYLKEYKPAGSATNKSFDMKLRYVEADDSFVFREDEIPSGVSHTNIGSDDKDTGTGNVGNQSIVKFQLNTSSRSYSNDLVLSNPAKRANIKLAKKDADTGEGLSGAEFVLYERSEFYKLIKNNPDITVQQFVENAAGKPKATSVENGDVSFNNILFGDYVLVETKAPDNYSSHSPYSLSSIVKTMFNAQGNMVSYKAFNKLNDSHKYNITVKYGNVIECSEGNNISSFDIDNTKVGSVSIEKTGKVNDNSESTRLANAEFGLYTLNDSGKWQPVLNSAGKKCIGSTDSNGHLEFDEIPYGEYYLIETKAPDGYLVAPTYKSSYLKKREPNVVIDDDNRTVSVRVDDPPQAAGIRLTKKLITADNGSTRTYEVPNGLVSFISNKTIKKNYSYDSVSFSFYTSKAAAMGENEAGLLAIDSANGDSSINVAENLKLDENGELNIEFNKTTSGAVTYYYREKFDGDSHLSPTNADGNGKDTSEDALNKVYPVTIKSGETSAHVIHKNWVDRGNSITINKIDSVTEDFLPGAVFKVEFFDNKFASASQIGDTEPAYVYYIGSSNSRLNGNNGTNADSLINIGSDYSSSYDLRNDYELQEDAFNIYNKAYFPEGSYRVTEVQAPAGYSRDDTVYFGNLNGDEDTIIYIGKTVREGSDLVAVSDKPYAPIEIKKTDADTGDVLEGAIFKLEYFENRYTRPTSIPKSSDYTYYLKTDENGIANTTNSSCYVNEDGTNLNAVQATSIEDVDSPVYKGLFKRGGTYRVIEVKAPDGYKLDSSSGIMRWGVIDDTTGQVSLSYSNEKIPSITIEGSKIWDDLRNTANRRPYGIRVELYRDGSLFGSQLLGDTESGGSGAVWYDFTSFQHGENGDSQYDYSFTDLPEGYYDENGNYVRYEYSVREIQLTALRGSLHQAGKVLVSSLTELKDSPYTGLYQNSRAVVKSGGVQVYNQEIGNIATKQATATISGSNINWTVSDVPLGTTPLRVDIKNTYRPEPISVTVTKDWVDNSNQYQTRPSSIQVKLYRRWDASEFVDVDMSHPTDGILTEQVGSVYTISAANGWRLVIPGLSEFATELDGHKPSKDLGQYFDTGMSDFYYDTEYEYYVEEVPVGNGYVTEQTGDLSLTNYETKNIVLEKRWNDRSNAANKRPTSVDFTLYREYVVPGYYTTNGESVTITKTVGTYTIDNFTDNKGSVKVTGQPVVASAFFDDKIAEDLGSRLGTDSDGKTFTAYETVGEHAIPCRYYVTESTVTGYDEPEYLDHTQTTVQGVLTETIPVQNTYKVFDVVVKKYYRQSLPDNTSSLEAQLQGTKPQANVGFVLGAGSNGKNGVIKATGTNGVYEKQGAEVIDDIQNYFRARGSGVNKRILNKFADDSEYIMRTGSTGSNKGKLTIKNLEPGTYVILESTPVEKYSTSNVPVTFTLTDEGKVRIISDGHPVDMDELVFVNDRIFAPKTGGTGNMIYYVAALLALSLGVFGVLFFRRRRIRSTIVK